MRTAHEIIAVVSAAAALLAASVAAPALGAMSPTSKQTKTKTKTTKPKPKPKPAKLTKTTAAADARADAVAGATISSGDKVVISDCRAYGRSDFKCAVQLIPAASASRCTWTDTISLVKGKPNVTYSDVACSG
jgi:hypothetical protein